MVRMSFIVLLLFVASYTHAAQVTTLGTPPVVVAPVQDAVQGSTNGATMSTPQPAPTSIGSHMGKPLRILEVTGQPLFSSTTGKQVRYVFGYYENGKFVHVGSLSDGGTSSSSVRKKAVVPSGTIDSSLVRRDTFPVTTRRVNGLIHAYGPPGSRAALVFPPVPRAAR